MIHIHVPSYQTFSDPIDPFNKYTVYDIYVNGAYHASVRYKLLYELHEKILGIFGLRLNIPEFPPKKLWRLDSKALNFRRESLAKYLQSIFQIPDISRHPMIERNFLEYQIKSFGSAVRNINKLEIFLPDGRSMVIDCNIGDSTNIIMERFCNHVGVSERNSQYFGLFLTKSRINPGKRAANILFDQICVRWLKNFESPYISQKLANQLFDSFEEGYNNGENVENETEHIYYRIVIRRITWDPSWEEPLLDDPGSLKLLYLQAVNDIQRGLMQLTDEVKDKLSTMQVNGEYKQFLRLCHLQSDYGYERLAPVISDIPSTCTKSELKVGRRQLVLEYFEDDNVLVQSILRSTRIRVWRVSHVDAKPLDEMIFELEYFTGKDDFGKITLRTNQAVILSLFLQSIASEILHDQNSANSPAFNFDGCDGISTRLARSLEVSKSNSIVTSSGLNANSDDTGDQHQNFSAPSVQTLFRTISFQMPFLDGESFDDLTDSDL